MRNSTKNLKNFLKSNGIDTNVTYIKSGTLKRSWRLSSKTNDLTEEAANKLTELGFKHFALYDTRITAAGSDGHGYTIFVINDNFSQETI